MSTIVLHLARVSKYSTRRRARKKNEEQRDPSKVETYMMRIRLVGRRMEAEFALKVPVYSNSCPHNRMIVSYR
jgi:Holliday junction resolvase RusA-like endonuclease